MAECCRKILGFDQIDIHDNFFELGADSILLMKIQSEIERIFPGAINVTDLFEYSNVHHLAKFISGKNKKEEQRPSPAMHLKKRTVAERDGDIAIIGMAVNVRLLPHLRSYGNISSTARIWFGRFRNREKWILTSILRSQVMTRHR